LETVVFLKIFQASGMLCILGEIFSKLTRKLQGNSHSLFVLIKSMRVSLSQKVPIRMQENDERGGEKGRTKDLHHPARCS